MGANHLRPRTGLEPFQAVLAQRHGLVTALQPARQFPVWHGAQQRIFRVCPISDTPVWIFFIFHSIRSRVSRLMTKKASCQSIHNYFVAALSSFLNARLKQRKLASYH